MLEVRDILESSDQSRFIRAIGSLSACPQLALKSDEEHSIDSYRESEYSLSSIDFVLPDLDKLHVTLTEVPQQ